MTLGDENFYCEELRVAETAKNACYILTVKKENL
jgi:hypothetical protein